MKSKKGFTMMELLAAIVIVGILSTIGIVGVVNFRKNQEIKYNKTQNSMFIETAKTYFSDNKKYLPTKPGTSENVYVTLGELIEANYITEDFIDYNGKKYSPDSKVLVLKINNGVYTYRGSLLDEDGDTVITTEKAKVDWDFKYKNKTSDLNKINNKNYTNSTPSMTFKATSKNGINILAYMYIIYRDGVVYETSEMIYLGMKLELNDELILDLDTEKYSGDAQYKIKIKLYDESGYEIIKEGEDIVIDTVAPNAPQLVNLYENKWINKSYTIKGKATDSSGILEWQHTYKSDAGNGINNSDWKKYSNSSKNSFTTSAFEDEMDKYVYIRVCDYANNCSLSSRSKIRIDKTAPICEEPTGGNPTWINAKSSTTSRTITATCDDTKKGTTHSGCVKNSISHTYAEDIDTKEAGAAGNKDGGTVRDTAGNVTNCKANQTVKIDKTAPAKPSLNNPNDGIWVNKVKYNSSGFSYTIKGTTTEKLSGVESWQYTYNNNATTIGTDGETVWKKYDNSSKEIFTTTPFKMDRNQNVYIRVCDKAGNCSEKSSSNIKIDKTDPVCGEPTGGNTAWINAASTTTSRTITAKCEDPNGGKAASGCVKQSISYVYSKDINTNKAGAAGNNNGGVIRDIAGNTAKCKANQTVKIDKTAPTKPSLNNPYNNVWVNKDKFNSSGFSYKIKGTTTEKLSGVESWQYTYNNNATTIGTDGETLWKKYDNSSREIFTTTPFKMDRNQNVYIRVCDKAGNCSTKNSSNIKIDKTPPTTPTIKNPHENKWINKAYFDAGNKYDIEIGTIENGSGVKKWEYTYNQNSAWNLYKGITSLQSKVTLSSANTNKYIYIRVEDVAGNVSKVSSSRIKIDKNIPTIKTLSLSSNNANYQTATAKISATVSDTGGSGLASYCKSLSGNVSDCSWISNTSNSISSSIVVSSSLDGSNKKVNMWVKDAAGNISPSSVSEYKVYKECSSVENNGNASCGTYGSCSNACGGKMYATKTQPMKDKYTGTACQANVTANGCEASCGGKSDWVVTDNGTFGACSKACGGGTQSKTVSYAKYSTLPGYTSTVCETKSEPVSQNCNTHDCCGIVNQYDGTVCSSTCGGGTLNLVAYSAYDGSRCPNQDLGSGGSACNTHDCCSNVTYKETNTCSVSCGGGKKKREAYSAYNSQRCSSEDDYGGSACNTDPCVITMYFCRKGSTYVHTYKSLKCDNNHPYNCALTYPYNTEVIVKTKKSGDYWVLESGISIQGSDKKGKYIYKTCLSSKKNADDCTSCTG